ncbi:MAG: hypothetical protein JNM56_22910, partial [Planctomycetia bacterium]|nr:hypothetical protein [Planctomycetia bacterium]
MSQPSPPHCIKIGLAGTFQPTGTVHTSPTDIDQLCEQLKADETNRLLLYFHGGLNAEADGLRCAEHLRQRFQSKTFPITFVWETGLQETLVERITCWLNNPMFRKIRDYVSIFGARYASQEGGVRGTGTGPSLAAAAREFDQAQPFAHLDAGLALPTDLDDLTPRLEAELEGDFATDEELQTLVADELKAGNLAAKRLVGEGEVRGSRIGGFWLYPAKCAAKIVWRVYRRYAAKTQHGFYPTVAEEIIRELYLAEVGAWVWASMKRKAHDMWARNDGLIGDERYVGAYFLERLEELRQAKPSLQVDLVGHSAGSITICHLLAAARRTERLKFRNVIFLAPACTCELLHREIVLQPGRYERFRLFALDDALECADQLRPGLYTRSLLYLVSGALEEHPDTPLAGLQR